MSYEWYPPSRPISTQEGLKARSKRGDFAKSWWATPLRVRVEPPAFMRHDEVNGLRFTEPIEVEFTGVRIERGQD